MFEFLNFSLLDFIDILLVAILLFYLYKWVKGTAAVNIFGGIISIYIFWKVVAALQMELLSEILGQFIGVGVIALIIVFQQEIRRFLLLIGTTNFASRRHFLRSTMSLEKDVKDLTNVDEVIRACFEMSKTKTGALIVLRRDRSLDNIVTGGDFQNIEVTDTIIKSIFYKNSPLHDGAMVIESNRIVLTRGVLPVSKESHIPAHLGLRHRAAVGVSEVSDALCLVVSEETGNISYIKSGSFVHFEDRNQLLYKISEDLSF